MPRPAVTTITTADGSFMKRATLIEGAVPADGSYDIELGPGRWMVAIYALFSAGGTGTLSARVMLDANQLSVMGMCFAGTVTATVAHSLIGANGGLVYVAQITSASVIPAGIMVDNILRITYVAGTTSGTAHVVLLATPMA